MMAVTLRAAKSVIREYSIQILLQKQSLDSLDHKYKASTSTNNVFGSSAAYSHKIYQKLSLHKIAQLRWWLSLILGKDENQHKMLKIQQIFPKLYRCLRYVVFHNLEPQNARLVDVKRDLH